MNTFTQRMRELREDLLRAVDELEQEIEHEGEQHTYEQMSRSDVLNDFIEYEVYVRGIEERFVCVDR